MCQLILRRLRRLWGPFRLHVWTDESDDGGDCDFRPWGGAIVDDGTTVETGFDRSSDRGEKWNCQGIPGIFPEDMFVPTTIPPLVLTASDRHINGNSTTSNLNEV